MRSNSLWWTLPPLKNDLFNKALHIKCAELIDGRLFYLIVIYANWCIYMYSDGYLFALLFILMNMYLYEFWLLFIRIVIYPN